MKKILIAMSLLFINPIFGAEEFSNVDNFFKNKVGRNLTVCSYSSSLSFTFKNQSLMKIERKEIGEEATVYHINAGTKGTRGALGLRIDGDEKRVEGEVIIRHPKVVSTKIGLRLSRSGSVDFNIGNIDLKLKAFGKNKIIGITDDSIVEIIDDLNYKCLKTIEE